MSLVGVFLGLAVLNHIAFAMTGYPVFWCALVAACKPLSFYVQLLNVALALGIVVGGVVYGSATAIKVAIVLFLLNLAPSIAGAVLSYGATCNV